MKKTKTHTDNTFLKTHIIEIIEEKTELELQSKDKKALDVDPAQFGNIMSKQILYVMPV